MLDLPLTLIVLHASSVHTCHVSVILKIRAAVNHSAFVVMLSVRVAVSSPGHVVFTGSLQSQVMLPEV